MALSAVPTLAAFDEDATAGRHVGVNVYIGNQLARIATGIVIAPGTVLADAQTLSRGRRQTVVSTGGAEVAASITHTDSLLSLAVLEAPGLKQTALPFAFEEVAADENRFVHAVSYDASSPGRFVFRTGSIGGAGEAAVRRSDDTVPVYRHNARIDASGFGGSLLNNCGELIGINRPDPSAGGLFSDPLRPPEDVVVASRLTRIAQRLDEWGITYLKSGDECLSDADAAAAVATQKANESVQALRELEQAKRREQELSAAAEAARAASDVAREDAVAAHEQAAAALEAAEARRQEAEDDAEAARQDAAAEAGRLREMLTQSSEQQEALQRRSWTLTLTAAVIAASLAALAALLWVRNRRKSALVALATANTQAAQRQLADTRAGAFPDLMLEGSDDEGASFGLKIPGASLHAGVDGVVIGRSPGRAAFVLDHPSISRAHCRLRLVNGVLHVEDLRTTNGVLLNDGPLHADELRPLQENDRLTLGTVELTVRFL